MQLFLSVMTKDTRVQSTNHPILKLLERVVGIFTELEQKGRVVETTFHTKILDTLKQDSSTNTDGRKNSFGNKNP